MSSLIDRCMEDEESNRNNKSEGQCDPDADHKFTGEPLVPSYRMRNKDAVHNPFCMLQRNPNCLTLPCVLDVKQCYDTNHTTCACPHYVGELSEEAKALRDKEVEKLEKKLEDCKKKIERYEAIKRALNNPKTSEFIGLFGCFGCLSIIALFLASIGAGIYLIKLAWTFLVHCWGA